MRHFGVHWYWGSFGTLCKQSLVSSLQWIWPRAGLCFLPALNSVELVRNNRMLVTGERKPTECSQRDKQCRRLQFFRFGSTEQWQTLHTLFFSPQRNFVNLSNFFCLLGNVQHTCLSPIWSRWSRLRENRAWRTEGISVHIALPHSFQSSDTKWRYDKIWLIGVLDKWLLEGQDWLECKTLAVLCPSPCAVHLFFLSGHWYDSSFYIVCKKF